MSMKCDLSVIRDSQCHFEMEVVSLKFETTSSVKGIVSGYNKVPIFTQVGYSLDSKEWLTGHVKSC